MEENNNVNNQKQPVPPYVDYRPFRDFLDELKVRPAKSIDKNYLKDTKVAKSAYALLLVSLRSLSLIDSEGKPTLALASLLRGEPEFTNGLRELAKSTYGDLLGKPKLASGTREEISDYFQKTYGISKSTGDGCSYFFVRLAKDTKLISKGGRYARPSRDVKNMKVESKSDLRNMKAEILSKLPDFSKDNWEPDVVKDVLKQFEKLMDRIEN